MISIKSKREIELIRASGLVLNLAHKAVSESVRIGISTKELNDIAEKVIAEAGAVPAFKGYRGFPFTCCISVNEAVVHGFPSNYKLKSGDIVSVDIGVILKGYYSDAARTHLVGEVAPEVASLVENTRLSFYEGLKECYVGNRLSNIGNAIQAFAESHGYGVVRELTGHGVGLALHEEPAVPNYGERDRGPVLKAGMVLAIEPMINLGTHRVKTLKDGWTVVTLDGKPSAHYEETIAITEDGPRILTAEEVQVDG